MRPKEFYTQLAGHGAATEKMIEAGYCFTDEFSRQAILGS